MRKTLLAATALVALALSACGGGGDSAAPSASASDSMTASMTASASTSASATVSAKPSETITGAATIDANKVKATVKISRDPKLKKLISKSVQPPVPKNTATIVQKANAEFGKAMDLLVPLDVDKGTTTKAKVTLFEPTNFVAANWAGFPEYGLGKVAKAPKDRALRFKATINNTTAKEIYFGDMKITGTTATQDANTCRDLLGDDGKNAFYGAMDPNTFETYRVAPGKSVTLDWALVCQATKGTKMSIAFQVGTAPAKIYATTMP